MSVTAITNNNFQSEVMESKLPVLIDFWAEWCGPCRMLSPIVDEIAEQYSNIKVCKVNVSEELELAQQYMVVSIPTLLFIKDGKVEKTLVGYRSKEELVSELGL